MSSLLAHNRHKIPHYSARQMIYLHSSQYASLIRSWDRQEGGGAPSPGLSHSKLLLRVCSKMMAMYSSSSHGAGQESNSRRVRPLRSPQWLCRTAPRRATPLPAFPPRGLKISWMNHPAQPPSPPPRRVLMFGWTHSVDLLILSFTFKSPSLPKCHTHGLGRDRCSPSGDVICSHDFPPPCHLLWQKSWA